MKQNHKKKRIIVILLIMLLGLTGAGIWYVNDYYHSQVTLQEYLQKEDNVQIIEINGGLFLDGAGTEDALIFYPGAKVEYTAYLPLFYELAKQGVDCFLVEMPGNLAILGSNKAKKIQKEYDYENWYIGGHSLGGAMAASYASKHLNELEGLVLLAAYPITELAAEDFSVLSLYGSEDKVLNQEKLVEGRSYMPEEYNELCITGGNHAWFGNYGEQAGDGVATITREEQQERTINAILEMMD